MEAEIEVLHPGLFSTIQDLGRTGFLKFGVPMSGPMDKYAAGIANLILRNSPNSAILEITQMGPQLQFSSSTKITITGGNFSPAINKEPILNNHIYKIFPGDILSFGKRIFGCRCYLGISGGFKTEQVFGSKSWYEGITPHYHLQKGMKLNYIENSSPKIETYAAIKLETESFEDNRIKVFPGPEFHFLPDSLQKLLLSQLFSIDKNNSRMAVQLLQPIRNSLDPIITGPVIPGTVQLTPSGKLIILMRDCQTTGGYPRVLQVSERGINAIAQKVVGEKIQFRMVDTTIK